MLSNYQYRFRIQTEGGQVDWVSCLLFYYVRFSKADVRAVIILRAQGLEPGHLA